jgi:hypothetical protein
MFLQIEDQRRLRAAQGYAGLGMFLEANNELEAMQRETRNLCEVLAVKVAIFRGIANPELAEVAAFQLRRAEGSAVMAGKPADRRFEKDRREPLSFSRLHGDRQGLA